MFIDLFFFRQRQVLPTNQIRSSTDALFEEDEHLNNLANHNCSHEVDEEEGEGDDDEEEEEDREAEAVPLTISVSAADDDEEREDSDG